MHSFPSTAAEQSYTGHSTTPFELRWAGFNGRCSKVADTCYSFWVGASLDILGKYHLTDIPRNRRYLLDRTQHFTGGFGKQAGDYPDIHHSYLGLAALAMSAEEALKPLWATACMSFEAVRKLESLEWRRRILGDGSDLPPEPKRGGSEQRSKELKQENNEAGSGQSDYTTGEQGQDPKV